MTARHLWMLPGIIAAVAIATGIPLIWSRDFGAFVIAVFFYLPALVIVCGALLVAAFFIKIAKFRRAVAWSLLAIALSLTAAFFTGRYAHDRVEFAFWYPFHIGVVERYAGRDAIIGIWDSWGMAGINNDAYLVSVPADTITDTASASRWLHSHHQACPVAEVRRMRRGVYIFATSNCPLQ